MRTEVFTCDEKGCDARHEREPSQVRPLCWMTIDFTHAAGRDLFTQRTVHLCPEHAARFFERYAHVQDARPGREVRR